MNGEMKYIIVADSAGREIPVVFGKLLAHKGVFNGLAAGQRSYTQEYDYYTIVSAGFVTGIGTEKVSCYGESESLGGVKSRGAEDVKIVCGGLSATTIEAQIEEDHRAHLIRILKKQDSDTKHLSSSARHRAAIEFATTNFPKETETFGAEVFINIVKSSGEYHK